MAMLLLLQVTTAYLIFFAVLGAAAGVDPIKDVAAGWNATLAGHAGQTSRVPADVDSPDIEGVCAVCHEPLPPAHERLCTPCNHEFHSRCFNQWIEDPEHQTCPMCRREILTRVRSYCRVKKPCRRMVPPELVALRHME